MPLAPLVAVLPPDMQVVCYAGQLSYPSTLIGRGGEKGAYTANSNFRSPTCKIIEQWSEREPKFSTSEDRQAKASHLCHMYSVLCTPGTSQTS